MFRKQSRLFGYLLPIALAAVFLPAQASAQKLEIVYYGPPTLSLSSDTSVVSACSNNLAQVKLNARASSSAGHPIRYRWSTSAGRINGNGPSAVWDLLGLAPGVYKAYIDIETGSIDDECNVFSSATVVVKDCPPVRPACPNVEIICPTNIAIDQPLTFTSNRLSTSSGVAPIYNWSVSAGSIIQGQGTPTIKVDTTGLAGQTIKATLSMGGYTLDCSANCAVSMPVPEAKVRKFDEFPDISRNDEKARLDNYAIALQQDTSSTATILVYAGRTDPAGTAQARADRLRSSPRRRRAR
jgi:hypothetical protein